METVVLSEFHKLFTKDLVGCKKSDRDFLFLLNVEESNVNAVTFSIDGPSTAITKDIVNRVAEILKDINALTIKYDSEEAVSFTTFCRSDPELQQITCMYNIIKPYQDSNILYESIAMLSTVKDATMLFDGYARIRNPMATCEYWKQYIMTKIDETKPIVTDIDLVNIFKSKFDFNVRYDYRDVGYVLVYLKANRYIYEQPTISREESYEDYVNFCDRNYLNDVLNRNIFGNKMKILCGTIHTAINDKRIKKYYLSKFGKSCLDKPKNYYDFLKKEEDNKRSNAISDAESFDKYFEENRDYYEDCRLTKLEAYEDYKDFCNSNSYSPLQKSSFYRLMLNECVVKRSKERNGSECFVIEDCSSRKILNKIKNRVPRIDDNMKHFIRLYHKDFKSYNYTRPEAFELYISFCETSSQEFIKKHEFYKEMQKYCIECRHRPSPNEDAKVYFIIRDEAIPRNEIAVESLFWGPPN